MVTSEPKDFALSKKPLTQDTKLFENWRYYTATVFIIRKKLINNHKALEFNL
jgi:hypothetical protein